MSQKVTLVLTVSLQQRGHATSFSRRLFLGRGPSSSSSSSEPSLLGTQPSKRKRTPETPHVPSKTAVKHAKIPKLSEPERTTKRVASPPKDDDADWEAMDVSESTTEYIPEAPKKIGYGSAASVMMGASLVSFHNLILSNSL